MIAVDDARNRLGDMDRRVPHQRAITEDPGVGPRRDGGEKGLARGLAFRGRQHRIVAEPGGASGDFGYPVLAEILAQRASGAKGIIGAMLESNLVSGAQSLGKNRSALVYGQSITDQCIDWETTETLVREAAQ